MWQWEDCGCLSGVRDLEDRDTSCTAHTMSQIAAFAERNSCCGRASVGGMSLPKFDRGGHLAHPP